MKGSMMSGNGARPLEGITIVDLTTIIMGPYATSILADMGAEVIKVEAPEGDRTRTYKPYRNAGMSGQMLNLHRNKQSIVLDLKKKSDLDALYDLVSRAEGFIHNLRPAAAKKLGVDYPAISKINPRVVHCVAVGFGSQGPYANKAAYDDLIQAGSGLAALFGRMGEEPRYVPTVLCDKLVGSTAAWAMLGGLLGAHRSGKGMSIEVPMLETAVTFMLVEHMIGGAFDPPLDRIGYSRLLSRERKPFRSKDGYICILPYSDQNWSDFFAFVGRTDLAADPRYQEFSVRVSHLAELYVVIAEVAPQRTSAEWLAFCDAHSIPCMPVLDFDELENDPHIKAVGLFGRKVHPTEGPYRHVRNPVLFDGKPLPIRRYAPRLGQDTQEVLSAKRRS